MPMFKADVTGTIMVSITIHDIEAEDEDQAHDIAKDRMNDLLREVSLRHLTIEDTDIDEVKVDEVDVK